MKQVILFKRSNNRKIEILGGKKMAAALRLGWQQIRRRTLSTFAKELEEEEVHAAKTKITWRRISLFVAIPGMTLTAYNSISKEAAHHKHVEEHGRPGFTPYAHLRLRNKLWPWGDGNHSLIHNHHINALPDGYEE